jgi:hypothetical protein
MWAERGGAPIKRAGLRDTDQSRLNVLAGTLVLSDFGIGFVPYGSS